MSELRGMECVCVGCVLTCPYLNNIFNINVNIPLWKPIASAWAFFCAWCFALWAYRNHSWKSTFTFAFRLRLKKRIIISRCVQMKGR